MLWRGVRGRCPVCGGRGLFPRWFRMVERCPRCGLRFHRVAGQWLGAWWLSLHATLLVVAVVIGAGFVLTSPEFPVAPVLVAVVVVAVVLPAALFHVSRTVWTAIDVAMRPLEFAEGVDPAFELGLVEESEEGDWRTGSGPG